MSNVFADQWQKYDGRTVIVNGLKCRIRVKVWESRGFRSREECYVDAVPISKTSKEYRIRKAELGDDWSTDVLASGAEFEVGLLTQLGEYS